MPQLVICHKCGAVLYEGEELKTPSEITESYDGKCPNCNKKLSYIPIDFEVKPMDENQLGPLEPEEKRPSRKKRRNKRKKLERKKHALIGLTP